MNLLAMDTKWKKSSDCDYHFIGRDYDSAEEKWKGADVDLVFGSNSQLRAIAEL